MTAEAFDGFILYSHAADVLLAPRLQAGLQRFAKPRWKLKALRVLRDESRSDEQLELGAGESCCWVGRGGDARHRSVPDDAR